MVLSPAFMSLFSSTTYSSRHLPQRNVVTDSPISSSYFVSSTRNSPNSSGQSIVSWCNEYINDEVRPSTSYTSNFQGRRSIDTSDLLLAVPKNNFEPLSAERRQFNQISLIETSSSANNQSNRPLFQRTINENNSENKNFQPRNLLQHQSQMFASNLTLDMSNNRNAGRNRVILERRSTAQARRSLEAHFNDAENIGIISTSRTASTNTNRGGFHFRIGGRSPFADISANTSNFVLSQNFGSALALSSNNSTVSNAPLHTSASIMAARKRRISAYERLNGPSQRIWVNADVDKSVHLDDRALAALLRSERNSQPNLEHFKTLQAEITESMRRNAVIRMNEICLRENCDFVVFPLAVSFMDRLLAVQFVPQHNLLALADAALLLAMKIKAPQPPKALNIVDGRQDRLDELFDWELFIVNKLGWALSTATPFEFFDQLIVRAPILEHLREGFTETLSAMLKDLQLACLPTSRQAAACLLYAADESEKRHLICESEGAIRKCFRLEASMCRSRYATNIRFALSNFFFDNEGQSENELNPPASKRFVLADELKAASSSNNTSLTTSTINDSFTLSLNNNDCKIVKLTNNNFDLTNTEDHCNGVLMSAPATSDKFSESWLFDDDDNATEEVVNFDCSFTSSFYEEQNLTLDTKNSEKTFKLESHLFPPLSTSIEHCDYNSFNDVFRREFNAIENSLFENDNDTTMYNLKNELPLIDVKTNGNVYPNDLQNEKNQNSKLMTLHFLYNDESSNEHSNSSCSTSVGNSSETASVADFNNFQSINDSGFNSTVSTPELVPSAQQTTTTTSTIASICSKAPARSPVTSNNDNTFANSNKSHLIFKHHDFGQLFEL